MSVLRRTIAVAAFCAFTLSACSSGADTTAPAPTSVPPALAFADAPEAAATGTGLWSAVETNSALATCLANAVGGSPDAIDALRVEVDALGDARHAIIADCLTGA